MTAACFVLLLAFVTSSVSGVSVAGLFPLTNFADGPYRMLSFYMAIDHINKGITGLPITIKLSPCFNDTARSPVNAMLVNIKYLALFGLVFLFLMFPILC